MNPSDKIGKWFRRGDLRVLKEAGVGFVGDLATLSFPNLPLDQLSKAARSKAERFIFDGASEAAKAPPIEGISRPQISGHGSIHQASQVSARSREIVALTKALVLRQAGVRSRINESVIGDCHRVAVALIDFLEDEYGS